MFGSRRQWIVAIDSGMSNRPAIDDTSREARDVMRRLYGEMSPAEKLRRVTELTRAANTLSLAGMRMRHPTESDGSLLLRLATLRLGEELVCLAYGPRSE